ncbi:MAG: hypothetical protein O7A98_00095, partial [Acidobacteria bacterium]|nr:hypothetical protein [Acidobacteriota bacterium]
EELYEAVMETIRATQPNFVDQSDDEAVDADIRARSGALSALDSPGRPRRSKAGAAPNGDLMMLTALANASGVSFYAYKAQGNIGGVPPEFAGDAAALYTPAFKSVQQSNLAETLRVLADQTGGQAIVGGDLEVLMMQARADFSGYYSLGFRPDHAGDGQFHAVKVKIRGRGLKGRYRTGYVDKPLAVKVADRTSTALLLGVDDNPLGLRLAVGVARPGEREGEWLVPVTVDVPLSEVTLLREGDTYVLDAHFYIAARSAAGDLAPVQEGILRIEVPASEIERARGEVHSTRFELALREGEQRLAIGFVDPVAAISSFVSRDLVVGQP